jgi:K+-sensing histidine kinase KdpD
MLDREPSPHDLPLRPVREAFLEVLSHELRTPITTIYAGSSVLARRPSLSASATQTLAGNISAEAARLYDLVEDLLVLARLERGILDPLDEPVLVQRAVDSAIRKIVDRLGAVPIERQGETDVPPVHGDATYVEQACRNLIMGSIRYAEPEADRPLIVDVRSDPDAGRVTVSVLDRGPGLARNELDGAFELPTAAAVGRLAGSGVGPFVCRHLVEAMGGRVWSRNRPDGGLETGLALPIDERA